VAAIERAASATGVPLSIIRDDTADERSEFVARLILVRPDQFVTWAGDDAPTDPTALFVRAAGQD
jgi:hypothetical protein